jgi:ferric-dicitrate binding protein FerR (iron transport regulator)
VVIALVALMGFPVEPAAGHDLRVSHKPPGLSRIDIHHVGAWLGQLILFEHEPLERVAAEFNRYSDMPIQIEGQALRKMEVSGVLKVDDTESFVAFLRSLHGVQVEVTAARIRVFQG